MYPFFREPVTTRLYSSRSRSECVLAYAAICPSLLAYTFWDLAMRKGRIVLVAAMSYLTPILSVAFTSVYLSVRVTWTLWTACVMVVAGAVSSKWSVSDPTESQPLNGRRKS